jgi:hypothetical protein
MGGSRAVKSPVNSKLRPGLAQILEKTPPAAEQHGRKGDFQPINAPHLVPQFLYPGFSMVMPSGAK